MGKVKIGHASIDEHGKISGGVAGDQNKKEVCIREWYSKPWGVLLRPLSADLAEKSAKACEAGCANDNVGYNQGSRNGLHLKAQAVGYDLSKINSPCDTDCSAYMTVCAIAGGAKELEYIGNAPTTSTMVNAFVKSGRYEALTDSKYLTSDKYVKRGDILVKPGSHTVMVLENGSEVSAKTTPKKTGLSYPCKGIDVAAWQTGLDYMKLKNDGVEFAILKAIRKDGSADKMFETHYTGFTKAGIPILGVYNFSYALTVERAKIDAQSVLKVLNGRKLPICLDVEDKCQQGIGERLIDIINAYQKVVEDAGLPFIIYTGLSFYNSYLKPYLSKLRCTNYWIARYYNGYTEMTLKQAPNEAYKPNITNLMGWQYTSSGKVNGAVGRLDCNILYRPINKVTNNVTGQKGTVTANSLRVREQPNVDSKVLGYLKKGEVVSISKVDPQTGWYKVGDGWASNSYIQIL